MKLIAADSSESYETFHWGSQGTSFSVIRSSVPLKLNVVITGGLECSNPFNTGYRLCRCYFLFFFLSKCGMILSEGLKLVSVGKNTSQELLDFSPLQNQLVGTQPILEQ